MRRPRTDGVLGIAENANLRRFIWEVHHDKNGDTFPMRRTMRFLLMILAWPTLAAPAAAADYLFVGTYAVSNASKSYWCRDVGMDTAPLNSRAEYGEAGKQFSASQKGNSPSTYLLTPDEAAVVYKYKTYMAGFNCEKEIHAVYKAHDVEAAKAQLEKRRQKEPKHFRSEPQIVLTWTGSEYKSVVKQDYNGVEITYISRSTAGKTYVMAKGRNTNHDKAASVVFSGPGVTVAPILLQPGAGFTQPLGVVSDFSVDIGFSEPSPEDKDLTNRAIDYIKEKVRDHVMLKNGRMRSTTAVGVRG